MQLEYLFLSYNQIQDISFLQNLKQLQYLYLRFNQIKDISFLQNLVLLKDLSITSNQIEDIRPLQNLKQLLNLDLNSNRIQHTSYLQNLTQLQVLDLRSNKIQDISFLQNLPQLQVLKLNSNEIDDASFLQNLKQLKSLDFRENHIQDISCLQNLTQLQSLNLRQNHIQDISCLQNLTQLQFLDLSYNKIKDISFLQSLTQLQFLYFRSNQIRDISFLQSLIQLKSLYVSYNLIQDIKPLLFLIKNGIKVNFEGFEDNSISLEGNPITNPPIEIIKQGQEAIQRYFDRIEQEGYDFIFEAKLTLVGNEESGKTSLQRRILDEKAELPTISERTRGIKVYDWKFNDANGKSCIVHIWDFGGQDVYYPVHRFFLTENSVYILMASTHFPAHNFEYWIPTIYQFGGNSPIVLVQNCYNGHEREWTDIKSFYGVSEYNLLKPVYKINLPKDNWGLKYLKGFIQHQITELPHIGKTVPKSWVKVRERLLEKAKTDDYISLEKFSELCRETDKKVFRKTTDIEDLAQFLHDLGIILWYAKKGFLRNFVILKPEWAMNAVYKIIDDTLIQEQNGIIYEVDFTRIWGEKTYRTKINELKLMLEVFKIAFPKQQQKDDYIIPAQLNLIPDKKRWLNQENALMLEYHFDFMPRGIVNQLSANLSNKILSDESVWSDAVILKYYNSEAQIVEEALKKKILIKAKGHDARGLMLLVINSINNIIDEYRGVIPILRVPCSCTKCQMLEKPTIFDHEELIDLLKEGRETITCNKSDTRLFILQLLFSLGLESVKTKSQTQNNMENEKKGDTYIFNAPISGGIGGIGSSSQNTFINDTTHKPEQKKEDRTAENLAVKKWKLNSIWWFIGISFITVVIIIIYQFEMGTISKEIWKLFKNGIYDTISKIILSMVWTSFILKMLYDRFSDPSKEVNFRSLWKSRK